MKSRSSHPAPAVRAHAGAPKHIAALLAAAGLALPASAQNLQWTGAASEAWANPGNWAPWGLPSALTNAFIGPHPAIENGDVNLAGDATVASLAVSDGMVVDTDWHTLTVNGDTVLSGANHVQLSEYASMIYQSGLSLGAADGYSLITQDLTLIDGAAVRMHSSLVRIGDLMSIGTGCAVYGSGLIDHWDSGTTFRNDGLIQVGENLGVHLRQFGGGLYDLDGLTGNGNIHLGSYDTDANEGRRFRADGTALSDSFSGTLALGPDADFFMNLSDGWTIDANATVWVSGLSGLASDPAVIRGGDLSLAGDVKVVGIGHLSLQSDTTTILDAARFTINPQSQATFGSNTGTDVIVEGGTFTLGEDSMVRFRGDTALRGGSFETFSDNPADGNVIFEGNTTLNGAVEFAGTARFEGDVTVSGPSVIHADMLDMDGTTDNTWRINSGLVINAHTIDVGVSYLDSTLDISGGFLSKLTVNLDQPGASWSMRGGLELTGDPGLFITRVDGSNMVVTGDVSLPSGKAQIMASTWFSSGATVSLGAPSATLRMREYTFVDPGTEFVGNGALQNGPGGQMELYDGVSLDNVGLVNEGRLWVGLGDATVAVDRFTNAPSGELVIDIFGTETGMYQDLLMVSGGQAHLDGTLAISVINSHGAAYLPQIGDEFTILVALGGVSGTFASVPNSFLFGGYELDWTVIYHPHSVVVRLDNIVPTPGSLALLGLCGLAITGRLRRR